MAASASQLEALGIRYLEHFDKTRDSSHPATRLDRVTRAAQALRTQLLAGPVARYYETVDLIRVPYPTKFGLLNACRVPTPFMHILNRLFIVQFDSPTGLKTLLFSPSDIDGNRETPYFKRLTQRFDIGGLGKRGEALLAPTLSSVENALATVGIRPEQVDFLSYDHLHTQDLRKWLGTNGHPGYFPKARLLVMEQEWQSTQALLPPQKDWYCPGGIDGLDERRVIKLSKSVLLGDGVALVATPGHTEGNHSLVVHTPAGLLVSSENGVCADSFAPQHSRIPGVRDYARDTGMQVILNGNTLERGLDQYVSMILERELAGPASANPDFYNVVPSSEMARYWLLPGLAPTFSFGPLRYGQPIRV